MDEPTSSTVQYIIDGASLQPTLVSAQDEPVVRTHLHAATLLRRLEELEEDMVKQSDKHREQRPWVARSYEDKSLGVWHVRCLIQEMLK